MIASLPERREQQERWLDSLLAGQFRLLFENLPGTLFFAKDRESRLMLGNPAFLRRCGLHSEEDLLGFSDDELFPPRLAAKYRADDQTVMATGKPLLGIIELFPGEQGQPDWSITDKLPLFERDGEVCGLCGTVRSYEGARAALQPYLELAPVADFIKANFREKLDVPNLAEIAGLSVRQLERRFRRTFQTSPRAYLIRTRILAACDLLANAKQSVTEVALEVGFYDHSDFSRQFRRIIGQSPTDYRRQKAGQMELPALED
jgi:AraC-like DNA-binding protein